MAGTIVASTLSDGTNSTSTTNCISGSAKAWVNFNGTGVVAIRGSYNVSSITDNGTGDYTINFTNALPNANYSGITSAGDYGINGRNIGGYSNATRLAGSYRITTLNASQSATTDCDAIYVAIFSS